MRRVNKRFFLSSSALAIVFVLILSVFPVWATSTSAEQDASITASGTVTSAYATAIGYQTRATGAYSFASGRLTLANEMDSFAAGYLSKAWGISATAMGYNTNATGNYTTALGVNTTANGTYAVAIGTSSNATRESSLALGTNVLANGTSAIGMGYGVKAGGRNSIALGTKINVTGDYSVGIGLRNFPGVPSIERPNIFVILGGNVGIDNPDPLSKLAVSGLPNTAPDGSGVDGILCITNLGNIWVDDDGTYDCA